MEYNTSVSNPLLMGAIELMKAEKTPEHMKMLTEHIVKSKFLTPATVTPVPEEGVTQLPPGSHVQLPVLQGPDGKQFFMAFTDKKEYETYKNEQGLQSLTMSFEDYAMMLFRKDSQGNANTIAGFVINPFGVNIIVSREMVAQYVAGRMAAEKKRMTPPPTQK